jgi:hypothetical protein
MCFGLTLGRSICQKDSLSPLNVSKNGLLQLFTYHRVAPEFTGVLFKLGDQNQVFDEYFAVCSLMQDCEHATSRMTFTNQVNGLS